MLFINNPEARTRVIEESRRDHGQHLTTVAGASEVVADDPPSRARRTLGHLARPLTAG
jgi:hypothetical protein